MEGIAMIQKFKMTTFAAVLCLFGFMLFKAAPVFANFDYGYGDMDVACKAIKDGSSTDDQIDECFTDIWDRASMSTEMRMHDELNSEINQLEDEWAEIKKTLISQQKASQADVAEICEIIKDHNEEARRFDFREVVGAWRFC